MRPLRVAHVGHLEVEDDRRRWLTALGWLRDNDPPFHDLLAGQEKRAELEEHFIDLNRAPPRDFLAEQGAYDLVLTHNLWGEFNDGYEIRTGGAAQSPYHTAPNWRRRLSETGARYVFLAGSAFNVATLGGDVPGYDFVDFIGPGYVSVLRSLLPTRPETDGP